MNPLESLMPELGDSEYVMPQHLRVEGDTLYIPLHVFNGEGRSVEVEASFNVEGADETIMKAALSLAIDDAREKLA